MTQTSATLTDSHKVNVVEGKHDGPTLYDFHHNQSGKFVIAKGPLKQGTAVFEEMGVCKTKPDKYTVQLDADNHILCSGPLIYCNHSCDPNCTARVEYGSVAFVAVRDIAAGEAVTFDYNTTEYDMAEPFDCICGSENCKKRIAGFKNLSPEQQKQISRDLMSAYIRQKADGN